MVKALHAAGIEVILDVVYNHTAEGNHLGPTLALQGHRQPRRYYRLVRRRPALLHRLHRHRQQPQRAQPALAAADHGLAALLGAGDARRRVPLRPGGHAGPRVLRGRPALHVLRGGAAGPGGQPGQADRRAVGRRPRRLPGGQLPAGVDGVERQVPRHGPGLLARRAGDAGRVRRRGSPAPPTSTRTTAASRSTASTSSPPRRVHAERPGLLQRQAQRGQRRGQPRRREPQPVVELRRRGADRRPGGARAAGPAAAQLPGHAAARPGRADDLARRRAGPHPARQQQRVLPGQRAQPGSTGTTRDEQLLEFARRLTAFRAPAPGVPAPPVLHRPAGAARVGRRRRCPTSPGSPRTAGR